jgi:hypothetical protein
MKRILESKDENVLDYSIYIIYRLIYSIGYLEEDGKPNPLREEMEKDGTLIKLIEIFSNKTFKIKIINSNSA